MIAPGAHRDTIFLEDAVVVAQQAFAGEQYVLRLLAPRCAAAATPGAFIHLTCAPELPMRRPLSIMLRYDTEGAVFGSIWMQRCDNSSSVM